MIAVHGLTWCDPADVPGAAPLPDARRALLAELADITDRQRRARSRFDATWPNPDQTKETQP